MSLKLDPCSKCGGERKWNSVLAPTRETAGMCPSCISKELGPSDEELFTVLYKIHRQGPSAFMIDQKEQDHPELFDSIPFVLTLTGNEIRLIRRWLTKKKQG